MSDLPEVIARCEACGRWYLSEKAGTVHATRVGRRFCSARCKSRVNVRAWRARAKAGAR